MGIVMNMNNYKIEHDDAMEAEYGEEILCVGWNPAVALTYRQSTLSSSESSISSVLAGTDVDLLLQKMYLYQR